MHICFGTDRHPVFMSSTRDYTLSELMGTCISLRENANTLHLEYHPSLYMPLSDEPLLEFACQMVVEYHNHLLHMMHPDVWTPSWIDTIEGSVYNLMEGTENDDDEDYMESEESPEQDMSFLEETEETRKRRPINPIPFKNRIRFTIGK